jgi:hypothetical protein
MTIRNKPRDAAVFGVDLGKSLFHVCGLDAAGAPIQKATFRRDTLLQFFERATPTIVGMEACPGSQWLARKLKAMGHTVRIVPAKFVKPYVKSDPSVLRSIVPPDRSGRRTLASPRWRHPRRPRRACRDTRAPTGVRAKSYQSTASEPSAERCLLASALIRLASTAKPSPLTRPSAMQRRTVVSNSSRRRSLSRKRP